MVACALNTGEQLLSEHEVDSSSNIKRENRDSDVDMSLMSGAPCPSSLVKESLKRNITARLSLNHQNNHSSDSTPLDNRSLVFASTLQKSSSTTVEQHDSTGDHLLGNAIASHNNANNNKLSQNSVRNCNNGLRTFNNSSDVCANSDDAHRTDEGYHSNGGQDEVDSELTPPEDSSEDSDSENNYVLDFSVKGTSSKVLVEQKKEEQEVCVFDYIINYLKKNKLIKI